MAAGERLSAEDGLRLYETSDLLAVGRLANELRERLNADRTHYVVNRHINYTNVCVNQCRFCAYFRPPGHAEAYTMSIDEIVAAALPGRDEGIAELHIVGGCHPDLPLEYYADMLSRLAAAMPEVHLQALTAVEIAHIAEVSGLSVAEVLSALKDAGLGSLPGGGAEVFSPRVRREVCPRKLPADGWLQVMREAHGLGLHSNATMLYGHIETAKERVAHLLRLRELQDETGGFLAFIPLAYHHENTELGGAGPTTGSGDLKTMAVSRLMLDNFPHLKAFWIMLGLKIAQVAQWFGADDLDGTVVRERITHAAGATTPEALAEPELRETIEEAGRTPVKRDTIYNILE